MPESAFPEAAAAGSSTSMLVITERPPPRHAAPRVQTRQPTATQPALELPAVNLKTRGHGACADASNADGHSLSHAAFISARGRVGVAGPSLRLTGD